MTLHNISYSATELNTQDNNLSQGKVWQKSNRNRRLVRFGFVSAATAGAQKLNLFYGSEQIGCVYNTGATPVNKTKIYWLSSKLVLFKDQPLNVIVATPSNSAGSIFLDIQDV